MRSTQRILLCFGLSACTYDSNIVGGTAEQQAAVADALDAMTSAVSADIEISRIRLGNLAKAGGRYSTVDRSITLDASVPLEGLVTNFKHEFCHALDFQLGLDSADDAYWTFESPLLRESHGKRRGRREAFADICSHGPDAWALVQDCTSEGADFVGYRSQMFDLAVLPPALSIAPQSQVEVDPRWALADANAIEGGLVFIRVRDGDVPHSLILDPKTGTPTPPDGALIPTPDTEGNPKAPWTQESGVPLDSQTVGGVYSWRDVAGHRYRTAVLEDESGILGTRCVDGNARFVDIGGNLWLIEHRAGLLELGRVRL